MFIDASANHDNVAVRPEPVEGHIQIIELSENHDIYCIPFGLIASPSNDRAWQPFDKLRANGCLCHDFRKAQ
jgi:hypothetical protein